ncbi:UNVERIFIED_CONTAM: hypothetical protein FKN15_035389 [Acipenser sinensis]
MEKLWAAVSYQGTVLTELLRERLALPVPLGSQGATSSDWQQDDMLSIVASEEVGEQELVFPSKDVESDSTSPAVKRPPVDRASTTGQEGHCSLASALVCTRWAAGRNLAALVATRMMLWLSQAHVPDWDKAPMLDGPITPRPTFGPAVDEMLLLTLRTEIHKGAGGVGPSSLRPAQPAAPAARGGVQTQPMTARRGGYNRFRRTRSRASLQGAIWSIGVSAPRTSRKRKKSCCSKKSEDSEQMEKLWAAVSYQGTVLTELLRERLALPVPLGSQGATSSDWQQDDMLSIVASEEVGEQELVFPSKDVESDSTSPAVKRPPVNRASTTGQEGHCSLASALACTRWAAGRNLAALVATCMMLWLSQARVPDWDKAQMLDGPITPRPTFGPTVDEMLLLSLCTEIHKGAGGVGPSSLRPAQPAAPAARGGVQTRPMTARRGGYNRFRRPRSRASLQGAIWSIGVSAPRTSRCLLPFRPATLCSSSTDPLPSGP